MSDERKPEAVGSIGAGRPVERAEAATTIEGIRAPEAVDEARAVGGPAAVMAAVAARLEAGALDGRGAVRAVVAEVVGRELAAVAPDARREVVDEVVEVILAEPSWRARLLGPSEGAGR